MVHSCSIIWEDARISLLPYLWKDISCSSSISYSCRNLPSEPIIFRGHSDGISSFSIWGQDVISISRNRIGLLSLSKSANETVCFPFLRLTTCMMRIGWLCLFWMSSTMSKLITMLIDSCFAYIIVAWCDIFFPLLVCLFI